VLRGVAGVGDGEDAFGGDLILQGEGPGLQGGGAVGVVDGGGGLNSGKRGGAAGGGGELGVGEAGGGDEGLVADEAGGLEHADLGIADAIPAVEAHGALVVQAVGEAETGGEEGLLGVGDAAGNPLASHDEAVGEEVGDGSGGGKRLAGGVVGEGSGERDGGGEAGVEGRGNEVGDLVALNGGGRVEAVAQAVAEGEARFQSSWA
jgi:hypothetical protein